MSSGVSRKAWVVAASVGAVEALKDQLGLCRWNYPIRSLHQQAKSKLRSTFSQAQTTRKQQASTSPSSFAVVSQQVRDEKVMRMKMERAEDSLRTVMYLSSWGPN